MSGGGGRIVWVVVLVALAARAGWVGWSWLQHGAALEFPDEELHWQLARHLVQDGTLVSDDGRYAARMPLYPAFLGLFARWGEHGILAARLAQALLGALAAGLVARLAGRVAGTRAARVGGMLAALDPYGIFFANLLLTETLFTLEAAALVSCAWALLNRCGAGERFAAVGVAGLSLACVMTRPSAAGWVVLLWAALWLLDPDRWAAARRLVLYAAVMMAGLMPWALRNDEVIGAPAWLSTNGGASLYDAVGPLADGSSNQAVFELLPTLSKMSEVEADRVLRELSLEQIRRDPGRILRLAGRKLLRTWSLVPHAPGHGNLLETLAGGAYTLAVMALVLWATWQAVMRRGPAGTVGLRCLLALVWLMVIYFTLLHCLFVGSIRYRVPLMPLLALAGATALRNGDTVRVAQDSPSSQGRAGGGSRQGVQDA